MPAVPVASPPSPGTTTAEWLEIDGFSLSTPGYYATDLSELLDANDFRSGSRVIPGSPGVLSYRQRTTTSVRSVPLLIFGDKNGAGVAQSNAVAGAEANIDAIRAALYTPSGRADGTRDAILHRIASTRTAQVKVIDSLKPTQVMPGVFVAVLQLELPYGPFVP